MAILVVEDERKISEFLRRGLEEEGYTVQVAADGETGLELATANAYELIILDLMLPRRNGLEVCRALRARKDPQTSPEVETTLQWVGTRWDYLTPVEKAWLADLLPDLYVGLQTLASRKPRPRYKRKRPLE